VLEEWSKSLRQPIAVVSPSLYETLKKVFAMDVDDNTKKKMTEILK
jgi:hypothetical protein